MQERRVWEGFALLYEILGILTLGLLCCEQGSTTALSRLWGWFVMVVVMVVVGGRNVEA